MLWFTGVEHPLPETSTDLVVPRRPIVSGSPARPASPSDSRPAGWGGPGARGSGDGKGGGDARSSLFPAALEVRKGDSLRGK